MEKNEPPAVVASPPVREVDEEDRGENVASGQSAVITTSTEAEVTVAPKAPQRNLSLLDMSLSSVLSVSEFKSQPSEGHSGAGVEGLHQNSEGLEDGEIKDDVGEEIALPSVSSSSSKELKSSDGTRSSGMKDSSRKGSKDSDKYRSSSCSSTKTSRKDEEKNEKEKDRERYRRRSGPGGYERGRRGNDKKGQSSGSGSTSSGRRQEETEHSSSSMKRKTSGGGGGFSEQDDFGTSSVRCVSPSPNPGAAYGSGHGGGLSLADIWPVGDLGKDSTLSKAKKRRESGGDDATPPSSSSGNGHHQSHQSAPADSEKLQPTLQQAPSSSRGEGGFGSSLKPTWEEPIITKEDLLCPYSKKGRCYKKSCKFLHEVIPPRKMELCKFYLNDCCAKKGGCIYLHNEFPCKYYHTGINCPAGDKCKFSHCPLSDGTREVLIKHFETAPRNLLGFFPRLTRIQAVELIKMAEAKHRAEEFKNDGSKEKFKEHRRRCMGWRRGGGDRGARAGRSDGGDGANIPSLEEKAMQISDSSEKKPEEPEQEEKQGSSAKDDSSSGVKMQGGGGAAASDNKDGAGVESELWRISFKIHSLLNQIREQASSEREKTASSSSRPGRVSRFDMDFHGQGQTALPETPSTKIDPPKKINENLTPNQPIPWRLRKVAVPKVEYSWMERGLLSSSIKLDPRLEKMRNTGNPKSSSVLPMKTSKAEKGIQPLMIPVERPVLDPRKPAAASGGSKGGEPPGFPPQQNPHSLGRGNINVSLPNSAVHELRTDALGGGPGPGFGPGGAPQTIQAQNVMALALLQQYCMNMAGTQGVHPNCLMSGFPCGVPPPALAVGHQMQNPLNFQQQPTMVTAAGSGAGEGLGPQDPVLSMPPVPPFNPQRQAVSRLEKLTQQARQEKKGDDDLPPAL